MGEGEDARHLGGCHIPGPGVQPLQGGVGRQLLDDAGVVHGIPNGCRLGRLAIQHSLSSRGRWRLQPKEHAILGFPDPQACLSILGGQRRRHVCAGTAGCPDVLPLAMCFPPDWGGASSSMSGGAENAIASSHLHLPQGLGGACKAGGGGAGGRQHGGLPWLACLCGAGLRRLQDLLPAASCAPDAAWAGEVLLGDGAHAGAMPARRMTLCCAVPGYSVLCAVLEHQPVCDAARLRKSHAQGASARSAGQLPGEGPVKQCASCLPADADLLCLWIHSHRATSQRRSIRCRMLRGARCGGGPGTFPSHPTLGGSASRPFAECSLTAYRARYGCTCARRLLLHRHSPHCSCGCDDDRMHTFAPPDSCFRMLKCCLMCLDRDITKLLGSMVSEDLMHWTETFSLYVAPRKVSF